MHRFAKCLLVGVLMVSIGAQWAALQAVAWVSMAVTYTVKTGSVAEALSDTFDGQHPCKLCCIVKKGSESQKKDSKQDASKKKLELFGDGEAVVLVRNAPSVLPRSHFEAFGEARAFVPALGPPRTTGV